ncbi:hypothetical protein CERZMDRAFT_59147 [Cercospora zeae-maydis SCOH1-5]|uniref:Serine aminopeptidase S33 domain-containing protein n=1 Tax=Cercospora zeae-maydis SCOH1-5 TaxID=717836 RepID=A0A6A6FFQ8_9PEZI|nr:hypothetical protein CERZMDRAFT_59147 [Cercospora zeae-maydis SCOH1-5]
MDFRFLIRRPNLSSRKDFYIALSIPAVTFLTAKLIMNLYNIASSDGIPKRPKVLKAPSTKLLTAEEYETVPYPPDALPGARNVATPYGNIRVYEWGPETGRKILFVHGISTPCIALSRVAGHLVKKGCRVMLFDLPGRGYSDCPDTNHYHQDINLFSTCILSVISSSHLPWTPAGFTLIGYSLGGGIAAGFTAHYPDLIESLVLIAPGGLLRPTRLSLSSKILYSGLLPDSVVNYFVGHSLSPIFDERPNISPATAVAWQLETHPGFIPAFISCIKYAPIHDGWADWRLIGERCAKGRERDWRRAGLDERKVLILLGKKDVIITPEETAHDATEALGKENVEIMRLNGGHDLVLSNVDGVVRAMTGFWESGKKLLLGAEK